MPELAFRHEGAIEAEVLAVLKVLASDNRVVLHAHACALYGRLTYQDTY